MALGYEGYVNLDGKYALGTGTAVPRARVRLESNSGYGGGISTTSSPASAMSGIGIGSPRTYDWEVFDGSLNFEMTKDIFVVLRSWIFARDSQKVILFSSRKGNEQSYSDTYWNSISISASEGSLVDGSVGFTALSRANYEYGDESLSGYINNKTGAGLMCVNANMPSPLNPIPHNYNPIPSWFTRITLGTDVYDFLSWTLDFSQEVVKFPACNHTEGPQGPVHVGVGPMTVTLSGAWMWIDDGKPADYPLDTLTNGKVEIIADGEYISFPQLELNTSSDDVQSQDTMTPVNLEYAIYEIKYP